MATAILPVKRLEGAKRRLGAGISEQRRRELVLAMLADVIAAIGSSRMIERTIVVSGDRRAIEIATAAGVAVLDDPTDEGHSEAALAGIERAIREGAERVILLPGDCPLIDPRELDKLLTGVPSTYVAIVPDRHGTGTNSLVLSPPDVIDPAFGEGSCERHRELARAAGIPHSVERLDSLALDLDTPGDIIAITRELDAGRGTAPNTARALGI
jgi:2-phospho-L-lactate/phosphoenolpyruvate guanylyltransferase